MSFVQLIIHLQDVRSFTTQDLRQVWVPDMLVNCIGNPLLPVDLIGIAAFLLCQNAEFLTSSSGAIMENS